MTLSIVLHYVKFLRIHIVTVAWKSFDILTLKPIVAAWNITGILIMIVFMTCNPLHSSTKKLTCRLSSQTIQDNSLGNETRTSWNRTQSMNLMTKIDAGMYAMCSQLPQLWFVYILKICFALTFNLVTEKHRQNQLIVLIFTYFGRSIVLCKTLNWKYSFYPLIRWVSNDKKKQFCYSGSILAICFDYSGL